MDSPAPLCLMNDNQKSKEDISHEVIQDIKETVDKFLEEFSEKTADASKFLTMDQLEDMFSELDSKTRKTYLNMLSDSLSNINEKDLIKSKKASSPKEG